MEYQAVKEKLEMLKLELVTKMDDPNLTSEEKTDIKKAIDNYEYIIELTDMNHYERGRRLIH